MEFKIESLANHPEMIRTVSKWIWETWSKNSGKTIEQIEYRTRRCLNRNKVPQTFVAIKDKKPIGTVSLWTNDLKSRQDLSPWLATLFVESAFRNKGVGTELQKFAIKKAKKLGYKSLYLITDYKDYYEKMGWEFLEKAPLDNGKLTRIYEYKINL